MKTTQINNVQLNNRKLLLQSLHNGMVIFTGAGISMDIPSSLPCALSIKMILKEELINGANFSITESDRFSKLIDAVFYSVPMETIFEAFLRCGIQSVFNCLSSIYYASPNKNHYAIAKGCGKGFFKSIFTLNFDLLHQKALRNLRIPFKSFTSDSDYSGFKLNNQVNIFHLHNGIESDYAGCLDLSHLQASTSSVRSELTLMKKRVFEEYLQKYDILCVGYSNEDLDTFPVIQRTPNNVYWYSHFSNSLSIKIKDISNSRNNFYIVNRNEQVEMSVKDFLCNLDGNFNFCNEKVDLLRKNVDYQKLIRFRLQEIIQTTSDSKEKVCREIIADILNLVGKWSESLELLSSVKIGKYKKILPRNKFRIQAHIYEREGKIKKAIKCYWRLYKISEKPNDKAKYLLLTGSAIFGMWKRFPFLPLLPLYNRCLKNAQQLIFDNVPETNSLIPLFYFERGDYYHFMGGSFLTISYPLIRLCRNDLNRFVSNRLFILVCKVGDFFFQSIFRRKKEKYFENAKKFYCSGISYEGEDDQYIFLNYCRLLEISALRKQKDECVFFYEGVIRAMEYYSREQINHGVGNAILAIAYYKNFVEELDIDQDITAALQYYEVHQAGILKTMALKVRSKY